MAAARPTERDPASYAARAAEIPLSPRFGWDWRLAFAAAGAGVALLVYEIVVVLVAGVGLWGINIPYVWGFDLINYAYWIGVANGAVLVAVILVLRRNDLRSAVNRFAEATALAGVVCAGIFPIIHLGRPWLFYWMVPYPATYQVWPQFRSTLVWDFWAIASHTATTILLLYVGLVPDMATLRDHARSRLKQAIYGALSLGWTGSARQWAYQQAAYRLLAALILPLILVMQSTVSLEHAAMLPPGWHESSQPMHYIVTGLLSGLGAVLLTSALLRRFLALKDVIDREDLALVGKLVAATALLVAYVLATWLLLSYLGDAETRRAALERVGGEYAWSFWASLALMVLAPQALWLERVRTGTWGAVLVALALNVGVWLDRFSIMIGGYAHRRMPTPAAAYWPTGDEWLLLVGTAGLFAAILLAVVRLVPAVSLFEARQEQRRESSP